MPTLQKVKASFLQLDHESTQVNRSNYVNKGNDIRLNDVNVITEIIQSNNNYRPTDNSDSFITCVNDISLDVDANNMSMLDNVNSVNDFITVNALSAGDKRKQENENENDNASQKRLRATAANAGSSSTSTFVPLKQKYTNEQSRRLKTMTAEEKKAIQCTKCEYFHKAEKCTRPGRLCFKCHEYGHEARACTKPAPMSTTGNAIISSFTDKLQLVKFLTDSCASHHIISNKDLLCDYYTFENPKPVNTTLAKAECSSLGEGVLPIMLTFNEKRIMLRLEHVQYVPTISDFVISCKKFNEQFKTFVVLNINSGYIFSRKEKRKLSLIRTQGGMFILHAYISPENVFPSNFDSNDSFSSNFHNSNVTVNITSPNKNVNVKRLVNRNKIRSIKRKLTPEKIELLKQEGDLWHKRMGHISSDYVHRLKCVATGVGETISTATMSNCKVCAQAKLTRKPFSKDRDRATRVGEILHADLVGEISPPTFVQKNKYFLSVIDDHSRYLQLFVLKSKDETPDYLYEAYRSLQALYPAPGQFNLLRCDNGKEFDSNSTREVLDKFDVRLDFAEPYCHEHNGLVERSHRTITERARALLYEAGMPANMWGLAVDAACWLYNRTPHSGLGFLTPFEKVYGKQPDLMQIKVFGSRVETLDETRAKGKKFDFRSVSKYLVGYTNTGYRVFDPRTFKVENVCNVIVQENCLFKDDYPVNEST